jgi:hypothetical protein
LFHANLLFQLGLWLHQKALNKIIFKQEHLESQILEQLTALGFKITGFRIPGSRYTGISGAGQTARHTE